MNERDAGNARVFHCALGLKGQSFFQRHFVNVEQRVAFHLHAVDLGGKSIDCRMVESVRGGKKPANIFSAPEKPLVGVVLGLGRFVGKVRLANSSLAEAFVAKLDN